MSAYSFCYFFFCHTLLKFCHVYNLGMCTSPHRVFYTGLKTESGKDLLYFAFEYDHTELVSYEVASKRLKVRIPLDPDYVVNKNGHLYLYKSKIVRCGRCDECRLSQAKQWAQRCLMECRYSKDNWFLTLTFDDRFCPGKVDKKDVSDFMKRLRFSVGDGVRFFACGEYGEKGNRPHYHIVLINCKLTDLYPAEPTSNLCCSKLLDRIWPYGMHRLGPVTQETVNYVARYTSKKTGAKKGFLLMSRRPGLGYRFIMDSQRTLPFDYLPLLVNGSLKRIKPPRYAERILSFDFTAAKDLRIRNAQRSRLLLRYIHGCSEYSLDDYQRLVWRCKAERLQKKEL